MGTLPPPLQSEWLICRFRGGPRVTRFRSKLWVLPVVLVASLAMSGAASSAQTLTHRTLMRVAANQSQNWSGYNQGSQALGGVLFNEVAGDWTVPTPSQHTAGQAEYSSDWVGIGGGCVDAACTVGDNTLVQTGTEQDISKTGARTYSAWYELIPAPETVITTMTVHPGDRMHAEVAETVADSNVWNITLTDTTTGQTFTTTTPYSSSHLTAEWIQERPTLISSNGTKLAPLPKLTQPFFDLSKVNGASAALTKAQEIQMTNGAGKIIAVPSAPDTDTDGFNACTYTTRCARPASS
jgi:hypothetical protein